MPLSESQYSTIFEKISEGHSLASCLRSIPCSFGKFYDGLEKDNKLNESYVRARRHQSEASQSLILKCVTDVLEGRLDPNAARVAIDALKWNAAKLHPAIYADKGLLGHTDGNSPTEITVRWASKPVEPKLVSPEIPLGIPEGTP
jgi:hypothetical protein